MGFTLLSNDIVINIFLKLEDDPREYARLASVSTRFCSLVREVCYRSKCYRSIPYLTNDLLSSHNNDAPPGGWVSLYKISVCCPGLLHSGILLENSDLGLERELGPDENYRRVRSRYQPPPPPPLPPTVECAWSMDDDLFFDTVYVPAEALPSPIGSISVAEDPELPKKKKTTGGPASAHLASGGMWNLSREQGHKLLATRFRSDCLYICNWPGCIHEEEKRKYMLFRGIFKDFKRSSVWRSIADGNRIKIPIGCAFCSCCETWDLYSAFCLRRVFGYHDDGEPEVRAFVCENGHVSGAWTERPMYG